MTKTQKTLLITGAGLVIGFAEALVYYNLGENKGKKLTYKLPPGKELAKTVGLVLLTSLLTAGISQGIEMMVEKKQLQIA